MRTPSPLCESWDLYPQNLSSSLLLRQIDATIRSARLMKTSDEILHIKLPRREWRLLLETPFKIQVLKVIILLVLYPEVALNTTVQSLWKKREKKEREKGGKGGNNDFIVHNQTKSSLYSHHSAPCCSFLERQLWPSSTLCPAQLYCILLPHTPC